MTEDAKWMVSDDSDTFDVVVSILERHRDSLAKINRQNPEIFCGSGLMDQIRMEQIYDIDLSIRQRKATVLYNPYTGLPRHPQDIETDPSGILIVPPNQ